MKNLLFLFFIVPFLTLSQNDFSYRNYLVEQETMRDMLKYFYQDSISDKDISRLDSLSKTIHFKSNEYFKYFYLFDAHDKRGEIEKATEYFEQLFLLGIEDSDRHSRNYLNLINQDSLFTVRKNQSDFEIYQFFKELHDAVFTTTDSVTFSFNKEAVPIWRKKTDELVNSYDTWIGYNVRGNLNYFRNNWHKPNFLEWSMDEKTVTQYYDSIMSNCKRNNEDWRLAKSFKQAQLFMHPYGDSNELRKLRNLSLGVNEIDTYDDNTLLTLKLISTTFWNHKITIYPTQLWVESNFYEYLSSIGEQLMEMGISYEDIDLIPELVPLDENEKIGNNYYFVIETQKK